MITTDKRKAGNMFPPVLQGLSPARLLDSPTCPVGDLRQMVTTRILGLPPSSGPALGHSARVAVGFPLEHSQIRGGSLPAQDSNCREKPKRFTTSFLLPEALRLPTPARSRPGCAPVSGAAHLCRAATAWRLCRTSRRRLPGPARPGC